MALFNYIINYDILLWLRAHLAYIGIGIHRYIQARFTVNQKQIIFLS